MLFAPCFVSELNLELITVGDEILLGGTFNTNEHWIANKLAAAGFRLRWASVVGDHVSDLRHQLRRAWNRADAVIVTGGLGPTHDDITRPVVASFFQDELVFRPDLMDSIRQRFEARGLKVPPGTEAMAMFPSAAEPIPNRHGSAPGIYYRIGERDLKEMFALPGVPVEMRGMFESFVIPKLTARRTTWFGSRIIRTAGIGESQLSALIGDPAGFAPVTLAYLPSIDYGVALRLDGRGDRREEVEAALDAVVAAIQSRIGVYIYTYGDQPLEVVILDEMRRRRWRLAVAESCTGGMLSARFTDVPGASDVFDRGYIVYSNEAKVQELGVELEVLEREGAVSEAAAQQMAQGALRGSGADLAASITGIAGPGGGSDLKPVGLVFIGVADRGGATVQRFQFAGDRDSNRRRSVMAALTLLWRRLRETR